MNDTEPKLSSGVVGDHQSSVMAIETDVILHPVVKAVKADRRQEVRDSGEGDQHVAEKLGYVKEP